MFGDQATASERLVVISGCSGGGKSTLITDLARRGYAVVPEPGRRIVEHEVRTGGSALPWLDIGAFARRAIEVAQKDWAAAISTDSWVFFDRGLIDAAAALQRATGVPALERLGSSHRYNRRVFLMPPWPEIYRTDAERRHSFSSATAEYEHLLTVYPALGYEVVLLPKAPVGERAEFVLGTLGA